MKNELIETVYGMDIKFKTGMRLGAYYVSQEFEKDRPKYLYPGGYFRKSCHVSDEEHGWYGSWDEAREAIRLYLMRES